MRKGFTLLEILVVLIIIGILTSLALPQYNRVVARSQAAEALTILKYICDAENVYYASNGAYFKVVITDSSSVWENNLGIDSPNADGGGAKTNSRFMYNTNATTARARAIKVGEPFDGKVIYMNIEDNSITGDSTHPY